MDVIEDIQQNGLFNYLKIIFLIFFSNNKSIKANLLIDDYTENKNASFKFSSHEKPFF